ncbi:msr1111 [Mesorhizobium japonicum MAFF 303099]|uniref:Msr1111 protein n=1 Tax=Mesorhizobium japonicum (strain LMG 29417 / CECT 9101 / MAFF 303099) TaxID=266835 RepID=Q98LA4_RHILO|nr:msr1111 [Mesorhizobium japonicum MAFF 303099]
MPPMVKRMPIVILRPRDCGMVNSRPKIEIFRAGIRFSSAAVIANGCPSGRSKKPVYESRDRPFGSAPIAKTANMRTAASDCEKPPREKVSEKSEMLLCKAERCLL